MRKAIHVSVRYTWMDRGKWGRLIWCVNVWHVGVGVVFSFWGGVRLWVCVCAFMFWSWPCSDIAVIFPHTHASPPPNHPTTPSPSQEPHRRLEMTVWGKATAGTRGILMTQGAVHWTGECLLNLTGQLAVADVTHHCHLTWPRGPLSGLYDPSVAMETL